MPLDIAAMTCDVWPKEKKCLAALPRPSWRASQRVTCVICIVAVSWPAKDSGPAGTAHCLLQELSRGRSLVKSSLTFALDVSSCLGRSSSNFNLRVDFFFFKYKMI